VNSKRYREILANSETAVPYLGILEKFVFLGFAY